MEKYIHFLKIHPPFNQMPGDLVEKVAAVIQVHHYGVGQTIFRKGDEAGIFYIIHTGAVRELYRGKGGGEETVISILKGGECFGAISLLTGQRRMVDAVVQEDVELYVIYKHDLEHLLSEFPAMNQYFNRTLTQKLNMFFAYFDREKIKLVDQERSAEEKERELSIIGDMARLMSLEGDMDQKLARVVAELKDRMRADACSLYLLDDLSDRLVLKAAAGFELPEGKAVEMKANEGITGWVTKNGEPVSLEDASLDSRIHFISEIREERFKSLLSIPLVAGGETLGAVNFQTELPRKYHFEEVRGMTIAGGQIAMFLSNAMLRKRLEADMDSLRVEKGAVPGEFVGNSPFIKRINKFIEQARDSNKPVLVEGEDGTGKELLARLLHSSGPRRNGPFVETDCAHFAPDTWGDELFGMEGEGDAAGRIVRRGMVEKADRGILFLKNIEKLNGVCQIKLFHFLQSGLFHRVKSKTMHPINVRIISTATDDLKAMAARGAYNKNALDTLSAFTFRMEPLRKMRRDIPELCRYLLKRIARQVHKEGLTLSEEAEKKILAYSWPGNVMELENVLKGAAILAPESTIEAGQLFFPSREPGDKPTYNLLVNKRLFSFLKGRFFPSVPRRVALLSFIAVLFGLFLPGVRDPVNAALWSLGWFFLFLGAFFVGRVFCSFCPFMAVGELIKGWKRFEMKCPGEMSLYGERLAFPIIFVILWMEGAFGFSHQPLYTAGLLMTITLGAAICSLVYQRRAWCRYLCPLGNLLGLFSLTSFLSINAERAVCMYRCEGHDCYTGRGEERGCQLSLHPYGIESQQHCVLCMQCHKNCPYGAVKLNLQFPATGILAVSEPSLSGALASLALLGILPVEAGGPLAPGGFYLERLREESGLPLLAIHAFLFLLAAVLPSVILLMMEKFFGGYDWKRALSRLTFLGYSVLPMALLGHIAFYGRKVVVWGEEIAGRMIGTAIDFLPVNFLFFGMYALIILLGIGGTVHTYLRLCRSDPAALSTGRNLETGYAAFLVFYAVVYLWTL